MPTLIILIILSLIMFLYYRLRAFQIHPPYKKKWTTTKANMGLGAFLIFFGANRLFVHASTLTLIICGIFIFYGIFVVAYSVKAYKYYFPRMIEESRRPNSVNSGQ